MGFFDKARGKLKTPFRDSPPHYGGSVYSPGVLRKVSPTAGASLRMQAVWRSLPEWKKNQLRRTLKDSDHDGVPDKFDCQPFNPRKQDTSDDEIIRELSRGGQGSNPIGHSAYGAHRTPMEISRHAAGRAFAESREDRAVENIGDAKYRRYEQEAQYSNKGYIPARGETPYTEKEGFGGVNAGEVYGDQKGTKKKFLGIF
jgi:hypothetical protein